MDWRSTCARTITEHSTKHEVSARERIACRARAWRRIVRSSRRCESLSIDEASLSPNVLKVIDPSRRDEPVANGFGPAGMMSTRSMTASFSRSVGKIADRPSSPFEWCRTSMRCGPSSSSRPSPKSAGRQSPDGELEAVPGSRCADAGVAMEGGTKQRIGAEVFRDHVRIRAQIENATDFLDDRQQRARLGEAYVEVKGSRVLRWCDHQRSVGVADRDRAAVRIAIDHLDTWCRPGRKKRRPSPSRRVGTTGGSGNCRSL